MGALRLDIIQPRKDAEPKAYVASATQTLLRLFLPSRRTSHNRRKLLAEMISLVLVTDRAPSDLANQLMLAGYQIYEALATSEVLYLCDQHDIAAVLLAPGVKPRGLDEIKKHCITFTLGRDATVEDVLWELSNLFQSADGIQ